MLSKLIIGVTSVLATESTKIYRELAGGAAAGGAEVELIEFDMEHTSSEGYQFHYANYGLDWKNIEGLANEDNFCTEKVQSPINLMEPIGSYGWAYGYPKAKVDDSW